MVSTRLRNALSMAAAAAVVGCGDVSGPPPLPDDGPDLVVNGVPDGDGHPNAAAILTDGNGDGIIVPIQDGGCSGFLIAPKVVATAGHCIPVSDPAPLFVSFDAALPLFGPPSLIAVTSFARHPLFLDCPLVSEIPTAPPYSVGCDIGVLVLASAPEGIEPVRLPRRGFLDRLVAEHHGDEHGEEGERGGGGGMTDLEFRIVGYGVTVVPQPGSVCFPTPLGTFCFDGRRRTAVSGFFALDEAGLGLDQHPESGYGGGCFFDSGAPIFLDDSDLVVAVHSRDLIGQPCVETTQNARLDTKAAMKFLKPFLEDDDDDSGEHHHGEGWNGRRD